MAFHPYPQLIPQVFNPGGFGPPRRLTGASPWPWVDHSASGLDHATHNALFGLAFATATPPGLTSPRSTNSQAHSSKGTPSRPWTEVHDDALTACKPTVSGSISLPSRGTFHHSLTVLSAIGHQGVFSLTRWSWQIHGRLQESAATREHHKEITHFRLPGSHRLRPTFPRRSTNPELCNSSRRCQSPNEKSHNPPCVTPDKYHTHKV